MSFTRDYSNSFQFAQLSPSAEWTINHLLNRYPMIETYVDYDGMVQKIIPAEVVYVNENTCVLQFTTPLSGFAIVI